MAPNPGDYPTTSIGKVFVGIVCKNQVHLSWALRGSDAKTLEALVIYEVGDPLFLNLSPRDTGDGLAEETFYIDPSRVVKEVLLVARVEGGRFRLEHDPNRFHLNRILSKTLDEVNTNLRWHRRISHLDTRFFSACNSIRATPGDFPVHARCIVSYAYTAMCKNRGDMVGEAYDYCIKSISSLKTHPDAQVKISVALLWTHIAIWNGYSEDLLRIASISSDCAEGIDDYPKAAYNSLSLLLLIGSFLLFTGRTEDAQEVLSRFESHFKIAANKYVGDLISYHEFIKVSTCAYFCKLGLTVARGERIHAGLEPLTAQLAWENSHRFRGKNKVDERMQSEGLRRYLELIRISKVATG